MTEINSLWHYGFENDHTYLKTTFCGNDDAQVLKTNISTVGSNNDVIIKMPLIEHNDHQNIINKDKIMSNTVNSLNVSNSNVFLILDSLHFPLPSNINISQNNITSQKVYISNKKSGVRPIQPKMTNNTTHIPIVQTQSNGLFTPSASSTLNTKSHLSPKNTHTKSKLPIVSQDKDVKQPIKNKIINDYNNSTRAIKLSPNLLKRIQSGENLFMCVECDKIYTEHYDLLVHRQIHDKCNKKIISPVKEENTATNLNNEEAIENENEKIICVDKNITKQIKSEFQSTVSPKKQKIIFQGECIMCHSVFPDLGKHLRTVHKSDLNKYKVNRSKFHCYKCNMEFDIKQQLRAHEMAAHNPTYIYTCEHCFKDFDYKEDLEEHSKTRCNISMKYLCPYCDVGFPHSNGLRTHLVKHFGINSPETSILEIPSNQIEEYSPTRPSEQLDQLFAELDNKSENTDVVYIEEVSDDNFQLSFTKDDEDMLSPLDLDTIEEKHTIDLEINKVPLEENNEIIDQPSTAVLNKKRVSYTVCRICMIIVSYSRIGRHMKKKHNNAAPYQCEICLAEFNRKHIMDDHRRKHTNNKPHKCIECSKCFTYKHHLNRHMMIVHNADSLDKPFKCTVCDKAFSFKEYLTLHYNSRHKGKHYMCQICGKSFSTNAALNKHQLCHTDERPFMCEHCGRTFKCKTHCDTHTKNMHPGNPQLILPPEKFECSLCNKKFSTKVYRDMHFKRHNGQGHQCDICSKLFVSKAHMQRHIKIMHQN